MGYNALQFPAFFAALSIVFLTLYPLYAPLLGRKNCLYAGSHEGARRTAMFCSFTGTCKLHGLIPGNWVLPENSTPFGLPGN